MEAKDYLGQIRALRKEIASLFDELEELEIKNLPFTPSEAFPQGGGEMASVVARTAELEREIQKKCKALAELKKEMFSNERSAIENR